MSLRLFVVHGSHPCAAVEKALQMKGVSYKVWEWPPPMHAPAQRLLFGQRTVPALRNGGEKISGSGAIMRWLDLQHPDPPLFPADPVPRAKVEEAERWGDEEFQQDARDLIWVGLVNRPEAMPGFTEHSRLPFPKPVIRLIGPVLARAGRRLNRTDGAKARRRLEELPAKLDKIDGWIADGTIGDSEHPNAADLQIFSTVRLLLTMADARTPILGRPCERVARELFPEADGELPAGALTTV